MTDRIDTTPKVKDWDKAKAHLDEVISDYKGLIGMKNVNPFFGIAFLNTLLYRYEGFERSDDLYNAMMECE